MFLAAAEHSLQELTLHSPEDTVCLIVLFGKVTKGLFM